MDPREHQRDVGELDILVNNAAHQMSYKGIDEITADESDRAFRTNVYAMFFLSRAALRVMGPGARSSIRRR